MVIQVEQEAIVSGIWALSTEAGHRSHEGANADSALVDWLRPCPPKSIPPDIIITIRGSSISQLFDGPFSPLAMPCHQTAPVGRGSNCLVGASRCPFWHGGESCL